MKGCSQLFSTVSFQSRTVSQSQGVQDVAGKWGTLRNRAMMNPDKDMLFESG